MQLLFSRRGFVQGASATALLSQSGCSLLAGLLRLGVRGSLLRSGARAARVSRRGKLATFGRTGATTMHLVRLSRAANTLSRIQRVGQIYSSETEEEAVAIEANENITECKVDRVPISNTRADGRWLVHHSNMFQESIGTSLAPRENELVHRDSRDKFVGADIMEHGVIRHFDEHRNLAGTTPMIISEESANTAILLPDTSYLESELNISANSLRTDHGASLNDAQSMRLAQDRCLERSNDLSCEDLVTEVHSALERLEQRFS